MVAVVAVVVFVVVVMDRVQELGERGESEGLWFLLWRGSEGQQEF